MLEVLKEFREKLKIMYDKHNLHVIMVANFARFNGKPKKAYVVPSLHIMTISGTIFFIKYILFLNK